jgi:hypothetical protein
MNEYPIEGISEFEELKKDIQKNGQQVPIIVCGNYIIDGRHRYAACKQLGVEPIIERRDNLTEEEIQTLIITLNINRRHLSISQRAIFGAKLLKGVNPGGDRKSNHYSTLNNDFEKKPTLSLPEVAKSVSVGKVVVSQAKNLIEKEPDLAAKVETGELTINEAYKERVKRNQADKEGGESQRWWSGHIESQIKNIQSSLTWMKNTGVIRKPTELSEKNKVLGARYISFLEEQLESAKKLF